MSQPAPASCVGGNFQRDDVPGLLRRLNGKPFICLAFADKLAVMFEHHLWRVACFKADLAHVFHHGEPVADKGMAQAVVFPRHAGFSRQIEK